MTTKAKGKMIIYPIVLFFVLIGGFFLMNGDILTGAILWGIGTISGWTGLVILIWNLRKKTKKEKNTN